MNTGGRPIRFVRDPSIVDEMCAAIRAGNYRDVAAQYAGVSPKTVETWITRANAALKALEETGHEIDEDDLPDDFPGAPYVRFSGTLKKAEADREVGLVATVRAGGAGWQSSAWILERGRPQRWARRTDVAFTDADGAAPVIVVNVGVRNGVDPADIPPDGAERVAVGAT